jgi:hypothetical protein
MSTPLKKVRSGQKLRIPAEAYNAFVDAATDLRRRQQAQQQEDHPQQRDVGIVLVKNSSGADRGQFAVLGITGPLFAATGAGSNLQEFKNRVVLDCATPSISSHTGKFVVLAEPILSGKIGRAFVAGVFSAKVEIIAADDGYADVKDSASELKTAATGAARILWKESGTGAGKWAILSLGGGGGGGTTGGGFSVLRIFSNRTCGEVYAAYKLTLGTGTFDSAGSTFNASHIGADGEEVTAINTQEGDNATSHKITSGTQRIKLVVGFDLGRTDSYGKKCFLIVAKDFGC